MRNLDHDFNMSQGLTKTLYNELLFITRQDFKNTREWDRWRTLNILLLKLKSLIILFDNDESDISMANEYINSSLRVMCELIATIDTVFVEPDTSDKKEILYRLWKLAGLNKRASWEESDMTSENLAKKEKDVVEIEESVSIIKNTDYYKNCNDDIKNAIDNCISNKKYMIRLDNSSVKHYNKGENKLKLLFNNKSLMDYMYSYLSSFSHADYLSIIQNPNDTYGTNLNFVNMIYCKLINKVYTVYDKIDDDIKSNFYNKFKNCIEM